jgi:hypothetical protein
MGDQDRLRSLHDAYVWEVNAAVGEGRLDLVWRLAEDYMDEALQLLSADEPPGCGRPDCTMCGRPPAPPPVPHRRGWPWFSRRGAGR